MVLEKTLERDGYISVYREIYYAEINMLVFNRYMHTCMFLNSMLFEIHVGHSRRIPISVHFLSFTLSSSAFYIT